VGLFRKNGETSYRLGVHMVKITYSVTYQNHIFDPYRRQYHSDNFETEEKAMEYYNALKLIYDVGDFKVQKIETLIDEKLI
jgi:hypothetical protein